MRHHLTNAEEMEGVKDSHYHHRSMHENMGHKEYLEDELDRHSHRLEHELAMHEMQERKYSK